MAKSFSFISSHPRLVSFTFLINFIGPSVVVRNIVCTCWTDHRLDVDRTGWAKKNVIFSRLYADAASCGAEWIFYSLVHGDWIGACSHFTYRPGSRIVHMPSAPTNKQMKKQRFSPRYRRRCWMGATHMEEFSFVLRVFAILSINAGAVCVYVYI